MPRFRSRKNELRTLLAGDNWRDHAASLDSVSPEELINPLLACLPLGEPVTSRAAELLGHHVNRMMSTPEEAEAAKTFMRRLMWHMNEESGNIGWGVPEAFGEILAANLELARVYGRVLITYIIDTGHADNFCDHAPLRRSCYKAVERLAKAWPDLPEFSGFGSLARRALSLGKHNDPDGECRALAARALETLGPAAGKE